MTAPDYADDLRTAAKVIAQLHALRTRLRTTENVAAQVRADVRDSALPQETYDQANAVSVSVCHGAADVEEITRLVSQLQSALVRAQEGALVPQLEASRVAFLKAELGTLDDMLADAPSGLGRASLFHRRQQVAHELASLTVADTERPSAAGGE